MAAPKKWIALLRAVLPATHKKMSMKDLRTSCESAGLENVSTYIASGNLLFTSSASKSQLVGLLHDILAAYELQNSIILRTPSQLKSVISASPFADAARTRPNHLLVFFYDKKLGTPSTNELITHDGPERVLALDRELCVDYKDGVARSKLTPTVIERHLGQPGTARNWNTVNKLIELSG